MQSVPSSAHGRAVRLVLCVSALIIGACITGCTYTSTASAPSDFTDRTIIGVAFEHRVFARLHRDARSETVQELEALSPAGVLHIYIEGDGQAWRDRTTVSLDPTPIDPLMLKLLALDPNPAAYVGRPCYFGLAPSPPCDPRYWTSHRYSEEVVASLANVIQQLLTEGGYRYLALFGHSGGGTLAALLAERLPATRALVTLAPNLDVSGWALLHGYSPLSGSLDPAQSSGLASASDAPAVVGSPNTLAVGVYQAHWFGGMDRNVPPTLLSLAHPLLAEAEVRVVDAFDHRCCWDRIWPQQLVDLSAHLSGALTTNAPTTARASSLKFERKGLEENLQ